VWPALVGAGLHGHAHGDAYWMDIGTPERYLQGSADILAGNVRTGVLERLDAHRVARGQGCTVDGHLHGPAVLGDGVTIAQGAVVGAHTVLGDRVVLEPGATVTGSVVLADAVIGRGSTVRDAIVAPGAQVGPDCTVTGCAVVGPGVVLGAGNALDRGVRVFPGVRLPDGALAF
jgi:mannose-1-phosphate guanylyltransferase